MMAVELPPPGVADALDSESSQLAIDCSVIKYRPRGAPLSCSMSAAIVQVVQINPRIIVNWNAEASSATTPEALYFTRNGELTPRFSQ
jgi:hypothetical protein